MTHLTNTETIRAELLEIQKESPADIDRALHEFADSLVPIYYSDIVDEWREMPTEFDNSFQEFGLSGNETITSLMQLDLYTYYEATIRKIWDELTDTEDKE